MPERQAVVEHLAPRVRDEIASWSPRERTSPELSIVLATINERKNLPELFQRIRNQELPEYEIVVVDDGSTDGTREYVMESARADPRVRPLFYEGAQTLTRAQCQGIREARGNLVILMDADLQHPPEKLPEIVKELESGFLLVVATRYAPDGTAGARNPYRAVLSRGAEWFSKMMISSARSVSDPMSGYFGFRQATFRSVLTPKPGYKLLLTLLPKCPPGKLAEVGYNFGDRTSGTSKITHDSRFLAIFIIEVLRAKRLEMFLRRNGDQPSVFDTTGPPSLDTTPTGPR